MEFSGSMTALITPLNNGRIDGDAYQNFIDWQIRSGTNGVVAGGTTGESATLEPREMRRLFALAVEAADGRVPVIAGCGAPSTARAISLGKMAQKSGVDGVLHVTPYYNRPSQEGLYAHFEAVHAASELPIILYDVPVRTGVKMGEDLLYRLAELPRVVGLKDCVNDGARIQKMSSHFNVLSGNDDKVIDYLERGAKGCISVTANVAPRECAALHAAFAGGNEVLAASIQRGLAPLHEAMFADASPAPAKYALSKLGFCKNELRLPLVPTNMRVAAQVDSALCKVRGLALSI